MKKLFLGWILTSILIVAGCQNSDLTTFQSDEYSFEHKSTYTINKPTEFNDKLVEVKAETGRIEIFKMEDFGDRPFGFSGEETTEELDNYIPKETLTIDDYDLWLFYNENDQETKENFQITTNSFKAN